jgi:hypothetical protein
MYTYEQQTGKTPIAQTASYTPTAKAFDTEDMKGTSGAGFTLVGVFRSGRVGYRNIGGDQVRVRVEPRNGYKLTFPQGWSTPTSSTPRHSIVVYGSQNLQAAIADAAQILAKATL